MWRCPYCETYNEDTANFCMICGNAKGASPAPEAAADDPTFKAPEKPAPAPRPRPSNMWDNGEGLGGATDLKTLAAKRAAKEYEKLELDAAVRRKMYDTGEGHDISSSFDSHVEASRVTMEEARHMKFVKWIIVIIVLAVFFMIARSFFYEPIPPSGTPISLTESAAAFYEGPGSNYTRYGMIEADDSLRYLGEIKKDSHGTRWCLISHNGQIGYIRYDSVKFE